MTRFRPQPPTRQRGPAARPDALLPAQPPDEQTYAMLVEALDRRRVRLDRLRAELAETRAAIAVFEADVQARAGDLVAQLRDVQLESACARARLRNLLALAGEAGHDVLEQVVDELGAALGLDLGIDDLEDPDEAPAGRPGHAAGAGGTAGPAGPAGPAAPGSSGEPGAALPPDGLASRDPATRAALKRLYRDLARRCHPDLARDPAGRDRREALMQRVNEAFAAGDAEALRAMLLETESDDPAFPDRPVADRLAWARAELARLDRRLDALRREMTELQVSDIYRLWRRRESGVDVFSELEADLEQRIRDESRRLDRLVAGYRAVVSDRRLDDHIDA